MRGAAANGLTEALVWAFAGALVGALSGALSGPTVRVRVMGQAHRLGLILKCRRPPPPTPARGIFYLCIGCYFGFLEIHGLTQTHRRQTFHPAPPCWFCRRVAAGSPWPARESRRQADGHRHGRRHRCPAADRRNCVLCARSAHRPVPRLGDPALRHVFAASGLDQRAPGHAMADIATQQGHRCRRGCHPRHHRTLPAGTPQLSGGLHVSVQGQAETGRGQTQGPAHPGGLQPRDAGGQPRRIRGARRAD